MAFSDYRLCDRCGNKAFYDSNLNYEWGSSSQPAWPNHAFRTNGVEQTAIPEHAISCDRLGDWAVICAECAKTHKCVVEPITPNTGASPEERGDA